MYQKNIQNKNHFRLQTCQWLLIRVLLAACPTLASVPLALHCRHSTRIKLWWTISVWEWELGANISADNLSLDVIQSTALSFGSRYHNPKGFRSKVTAHTFAITGPQWRFTATFLGPSAFLIWTVHWYKALGRMAADSIRLRHQGASPLSRGCNQGQ